ncbi:ferric reductase like transmembrane component-domain-containing protein [Clohesyomyces aquaticus]|uniref:Ferric reductase like transmembrane component-domain-containing protein n=1 Tax=Clohesyomyces aquaticus TaxID=1231657 RepID=A0A1Y1Z1Z7_9PLEO|nr:ferric reductase like transmembrane component-domain-containing protein [Clohesyomyces aquaticus]
MEMSGDVWPPVVPSMTYLPLDDPNCINESCTAFYAAENASQAAIPFDSLNVYGHWMTWFYLAIIGVLTLTSIITSWHDWRSLTASSQRNDKPSITQKMQALVRLFSHRHISQGPLKWLGLPLNGTLALLIAAVLFVVLITFAVQPYYRAHLGFGSPPLAIRSGFTAFACVPILMALAGKANVITLLTGISYEKLNVVHRWVAWISFGLSWVHTIPFFWISYTDGGAENVAMQFFMGDTGRTEWGGVPPLIILFLLCILSLGPIRSRFYEAFYQVHILLAITYFGLLYWHAGNVLDSWTYLWATLALWLSSWFARTFWYTQPMKIHNAWFEGSPAKLKVKGGNMVEIQVLAPSGFKFTPSQHCFLRIPRLAVLGNHPFTICNSYKAPKRGRDQLPDDEHRQTLVFLTRTYSGFTKRLASYAASDPDNQVNIWIEGPYGGISRNIELAYNNLVLIAGGGGITACLPWLAFLAQKAKDGLLNEIRIRRVVLFWTVKEQSHFSWASSALEAYFAVLSADLGARFSFYITDHKGDGRGHLQTSTTETRTAMGTLERKEAMSTPAKDDSSSEHLAIAGLGSIAYKRCSISEYLGGLELKGRSFVLGCGPPSLRSDVANACAERQWDVLRNKAQEVAVHLEAFGD